jgi:hypothetical protein
MFGGVLRCNFIQTFWAFFVGYVNSYPQGYPQGAHPKAFVKDEGLVLPVLLVVLDLD